ncbi:hypothetical protein B0H16DRAFT_255257 [Mycena metata]|uniref:Uncharacterized protein n=1 Tax=Mycena metata TaxID=1033252 RepID=A0AAD7JPU2_9AGAR|nr:hypothetical protein B0H16DRAFT_255257 [Mycena metata]
MVLFSKVAASDSERVAAKVATNAAAADIFTYGLEDQDHFKVIVEPTKRNHDNILLKWGNFVDWKNDPTLPTEVTRGVELPSTGVFKEFVTYLALGLKGRLTDTNTITRRTLKTHMYTFFACWARYAQQYVPKPMRDQVCAFAQSTDLAVANGGAISTTIRTKTTASYLDLEQTIRTALNDTTIFRTTRMKIQFNAVNTLGALSGDRPGGMIESTCYKKSNECIKWKDISFHAAPNDLDPFEPLITAGIRLRNPKGHRGDESKIRTIYIVVEPFGSRATCLVTALLYMAFQDAYFRDIESPDEIFSPTFAPTATHIFSMNDVVAEQPVFRAEVLDEQRHWVISETRALSAGIHNDNLKRVCFVQGDRLALMMYSWRRMAADSFDAHLRTVQRDALLTHNPKTHQYAQSYKNTRLTHDLGGILRGREEDSAVVAQAKDAASMSVGRDANAPRDLSLEQRAALHREPELIVMREKIVEYKAEVARLVRELKSVDEEDEEADEIFAGIQASLRSARKRHREAQSKYDATENNERTIRLKAAREDFWAGHSRRQLSGESSAPKPSMAVARPPLADKTRASAAPYVHRMVTSAGKANAEDEPTTYFLNIAQIDPEQLLCDVLYRFSDRNSPRECIAAVNAYLGLPERRFAPCYPGESPTIDETCPACKRDCRAAAFVGKGNETVGSHIHNCLAKAQQQRVQAYVEEEYEPQGCEWIGCIQRQLGTIYPTRPEFLDHLDKHIHSLGLPPNAKNPERPCKWSIGHDEPCGETDVEFDDWLKHFGQVHAINARSDVEVNYCVLCPEWHIDELGDGLGWEGHLWDHWEERFRPFSERVEGEVDLVPIGVEFTAAVDNCVDYTNESEFGGALPQFHGHVAHGVAHAPMLCPFCVFDEAKPIEERMTQFTNNWTYYMHLTIHMREYEDTDAPATAALNPNPDAAPNANADADADPDVNMADANAAPNDDADADAAPNDDADADAAPNANDDADATPNANADANAAPNADADADANKPDAAPEGILCPVPSCGTRRFTLFDFQTHLVAFHRVPVCGRKNRSKFARLKLPPPPPPAVAAAAPAFDLTHSTVTVPDSTALAAAALAATPATRPLTLRQQTIKQKREKRKLVAAAAVVGWCYGCSQKRNNIGQHILQTRCYSKNEYHEYNGSDRDDEGPRLHWDLEGTSAPLGQAEKKMHRCVTCRVLFVHISKHVDDSDCAAVEFNIVIPGQSRKWGPPQNTRDWLAAQVHFCFLSSLFFLRITFS